MRKRNLVFPLVVGSLFMPSIEALERKTDLNSLENENNIYEAVDILIAEGGGGGGGMNAKKRNEKKLKDAVKSYEYFWDKREDAIEKGETTTKIDEKIKKYENIIKRLDIYDVSPIKEKIGGGPYSRPKEPETQDAEIEEAIMGGGPYSRPKEPETQEAELEEVNIPIGEGEGDDPRSRGPIKEKIGGGPYSRPKEPDTQEAEPKEKIAISKLDTDVGIGLDETKDEAKELIAKVAIASVSKISAKIVKLQDEFKNYNAKSIDERFKKFDEIDAKINALKDLQDKIDDFLNLYIDNVVFILGMWDQLDKPVVTVAEAAKKGDEFGKKYDSLVKELQAADIFIKDYYNIARELSKKSAPKGKQPTKEQKKAAGIDNDELETSLIDLYVFTTRYYRLVTVWGSKGGLQNNN